MTSTTSLKMALLVALSVTMLLHVALAQPNISVSEYVCTGPGLIQAHLLRPLTYSLPFSPIPSRLFYINSIFLFCFDV